MLENVGFLEKIGAGMVGIATVGYLWFRRIKSDNASDIVDSKSQKLIDNLNEQLSVKIAEISKLHEVVERVAVERNNAVQQVGKLEATVQLLGERVEEMKAEITRLELENKIMSENVSKLTMKVIELLDELHRNRNDGSLANIKKGGN